MTTDHDDLLTALTQLRPADDPTWADSPAGVAVRDRARTGATPRPARRRRRRVMAVGVVAAGLTATGAAATAISLHKEPATATACAYTFDADSDLTSATEIGADQVQKLGSVDACRQTFADLDEDVDLSNPVSCWYVADSNVHIIFPAPPGLGAETACKKLGLITDPVQE